MNDMSIHNYIGGDKWYFSDKIYYELTGIEVQSNYNPKISVYIKKIPMPISDKNIFGLFWSTPTFKDTDSYYLFHLYEKKKIDFVISTSSGNTVEGMARTIKKYNLETNKNIKAILIAPELSSYKVASSAVEDNPYVYYIVLKNSNLDSTRDFATRLKVKLLNMYNTVSADFNLKTAAYAQIGLVLNKMGLMNEDSCFVQTVSGGVGPAGFIESAYKLKTNPEILVIQPINGRSTPIIDALNEHLYGNDPFSIFEKRDYETSSIETTLGSTKPMDAIKKFTKWWENKGRIRSSQITREELLQHKETILEILVKAGIYPNINIGLRLFELEKSGFIAFAGAINSVNKIESKDIIINFTGRYMDPNSSIPITASPHILYNPSKGIDQLLDLLNINK